MGWHSWYAWLVLAGTSQAAPTPAPPPAITTVQQAFDAATRLSAGPDHTAALTAWEALERRVAGNSRTLAVVRVRKSAMLAALGRLDEAARAATAGLAALPPNDATLRDDRIDATLRLASIAREALDYSTALSGFKDAEHLATEPGDRLAALLGEIETASFVDPPFAEQAIAKVDAIVPTTKLGKTDLAKINAAESIFYLNAGRFAQARAAADQAVRDLGGLTQRTDLADVAARSDYALAALLAGDTDAARQYMAMTGAGRLPHGTFDPAAQLDVPPCGGDAGLKPDDMAVVQFSVGDDGAVQHAEPIYAAGGGAVALEFARKARDWSWTPEQLKQMPPFFRYNARVELRCTRAFERPSLSDYVGAALDRWLDEKNVATPDERKGPAATLVVSERAQLAAAEAAKGAASLDVVPLLLALAENPVVPRDETSALAHRAADILAKAGAPPLVRLRAQLIVWASEAAERRGGDAFRTMLDTALVSEPWSTDPRSAAVLRLLRADAARRDRTDLQRTLLQQVADDRRREPGDALRTGALIRLASLDMRTGDAAAAKAAFDRSGLHSDQCALIDARPQLTGNPGDSGKFPREAYVWGFEGWTQVQFDISADGRVVNERALISYPPFVFTPAGKAVMKSARYTRSYRPDGGLGCGATEQRVKFLIPDK